MSQKCGYIAIVGRPNVGKSTLLNHLVGQKLNITSRKPQTTRHAILGIHTQDNCQMIFVDTPGLHRNQPRAINRYMNRVARSAVSDADLVLFVVDRLKWNEEDELVLSQVQKVDCPVYILVNKMDRLSDPGLALPHIQELSAKLPAAEIFPVSALRGTGLKELQQSMVESLPAGEHLFDQDQVTDKSERFIASEIVREKILRQLGHEVPYASTVEIESFKKEGNCIHIHALILVEREGQKRILIGDRGERLKSIGSEAREDLEKLLATKVMLRLWVKIKDNWSDDERALQSLGYRES